MFNSEERLLRQIANIVAMRGHVSMNADCPKCQERETLLDCISQLLSRAGYSSKVDVL